MQVGDEAEFTADIVGFEKYKNQYGKITDLGTGNGIVKWIPHNTALRSVVGPWDVGITTLRIHTFQVGDEVEFIGSHHFLNASGVVRDLLGCHGKITLIDSANVVAGSGIKWLPNDPLLRSSGGNGNGGWGSDARQLKLILTISHQNVVPAASEIRITNPWTIRNADGRTPKDEELFQAMLKRRAAKK